MTREPFDWDDGPLIEVIRELVAAGAPAEEIVTRAREIAEHEQEFKEEIDEYRRPPKDTE